jgi:hypothetical protein
MAASAPVRTTGAAQVGAPIAHLGGGDRHRVKSDITGWAQVHGLRGKTSLSDRVEWDNYTSKTGPSAST